MKKAMVITPTTGSELVLKAIESVTDQAILDLDLEVEHLVVFDGSRAESDFFMHEDGMHGCPTFMTLPQNVGKDGWYGHRVYAAMPLMVNADYILFLDEDNWFDPTHIQTMVDKIKSKDLMWSYSLRRIHDEAGQYICDDDCESLGRWPTFYDHTLNFVDTNCYCFRREYLVHVAHAFYGQWGADRPFYKAASTQLPAFGCTGFATVNYRAPERLQNMFKEGNELMKKSYQTLPWRNK